MAIKYKVVNVDIQTSISLLQKFIQKLEKDVGHYRNSVDVFYKNYLSTLIGKNNDTKYLRPYSEFNKVDSMYKKFKRFLNEFLTTILKDYTDALEIGSNIRLLKNEFDNIVQEYSYLYKVSPKNGIEVNEEFSSVENLKKLHYAIKKLTKIKQVYNERVIAYNEYILQFYGIERNFENRILTFTTSYNKTHSLELDYYIEYFMSLLQNNSIGSIKREILKGYLKNLTVKMEGFMKPSLRGVKKINNIDFGKTDSNNDQTKSSKQKLFSFSTGISQTEKPTNLSSISQLNRSSETSMPQTKSSSLQPISSSISRDIPETGSRPKVIFRAPFNRSSGTSLSQTKSSSLQPISSSISRDIPETGNRPKVIFKAPLNRSSGTSLPQTKSSSLQPISSSISRDIPETGNRPKVIFRAPLNRSSGTSLPQTKSSSLQPISSSISRDIPETGNRPKVIFRAPFNRSSGTSLPQTKSSSLQPISSSISRDIPETGNRPKVIFRAPFNRSSGTSLPQTKSSSLQPISSSISRDIPETGNRPKVIFRAPLNRISGTPLPQTKPPSAQPISSSIPRDIPETGTRPKPIFKSRFKRSSEFYDEFSKTKSDDLCPLKRDPLLPLKKCCVIPNANKNDSPYKKDNYLFQISNTCGFDSITQILLASITDDYCYASKMKTSDVVKFIFKLQTADNKTAGNLRDEYLAKKYLKTTEFEREKDKRDKKKKDKDKRNEPEEDENEYQLNFFRTLTPIWDVYFDSLPSGTYHYKCQASEPRSALTIVYKSIKIEGQVEESRRIDMSIQGELNKLLAETDRFQCRYCTTECKSNLKLNDQLFIDITIDAELGAEFFSNLDLFPISLTLLGENFRLAGVIEILPGHFVANVRRIDGSWEVYNDLTENVFKLTDSKKEITPEAAIYIKE